VSAKHPIISVTGSSGAGTSTAMRVFARLFDELGLLAAIIEGDAFHAHDRVQNSAAIDRARIRGESFSRFGPAGNFFERLESLFREYGEHGTGTTRNYLHTDAEAQRARQPVGTFTPWRKIPPGTDVLFYEGLHGALVMPEIDVASHADLLVGVVPIVNLEWIQKIHRDTLERGHRPEDVMRTILRRMPDYVNYITPQFSRTDVNFQRVPLVDTSNPFVVRAIPQPEETLVVIHFNDHSRVPADLDRYRDQIPGAFKSNANSLVVPGTGMEGAMEVILRPAIRQLIQRRREATEEE